MTASFVRLAVGSFLRLAVAAICFAPAGVVAQTSQADKQTSPEVSTRRRQKLGDAG